MNNCLCFCFKRTTCGYSIAHPRATTGKVVKTVNFFPWLLSSFVYFCFLIGYTVYHQRKKTEVEGVNAVTLILLSLNLQMLFTDLFYSSRIINTLIGLLFSVKGKDTASNPYDKLSEKFDGDPERKLIVGDDTIYSLAYMLCLDRSNLMELIYKNEIEKSKKIHYI